MDGSCNKILLKRNSITPNCITNGNPSVDHIKPKNIFSPE